MNRFYDLKIAAKLYLVFALLLSLMLFLGFFSLRQLGQVNDNAREIGTNWMPSVNASMAIKERLSRIRSQEAQVVSAENPEEVEKYAGRVKEAVDGLKKEEKAYANLITTDEEKRQFSSCQKLIAEYLAISDQIIAQARAGNGKEATDLLRHASSKTNTELRTLVDTLVDVNVKGGTAAYLAGQHIYDQARWWIGAVILAALILGMSMAWLLARIVSTPLQEAVRVAQTVAAGDLRSEIETHSQDETGQLLEALKAMNTSLRNVVGEVRRGTDHIATASAEIAQGNLDLSSRTENQASSLEETASSMEELTSTVRHNSDNAQQANQLAKSASEVAARGGEVVAEVVDTMGAIDASSKKIVDIISVIDGIAFQTNILALNAAVEAARAGEQGRGFAVVASEVRNLAQRSATAAKEIKDLIHNSVEQVGRGSHLVGQAGSTMAEVVDSVRRVSDIISEITAASREQSTGIEQVNTAVVQMDQMTQQNAALVEEAAAAAGALQEQAARLQEVVSIFQVEGSAPGTPAAPLRRPAPSAAKSGTARAANKPLARKAAAALPKAAAPAKPAARPTAQAATTTGDEAGDWEEF